jgi:hypothetical protein
MGIIREDEFTMKSEVTISSCLMPKSGIVSFSQNSTSTVTADRPVLFPKRRITFSISIEAASIVPRQNRCPSPMADCGLKARITRRRAIAGASRHGRARRGHPRLSPSSMGWRAEGMNGRANPRIKSEDGHDGKVMRTRLFPSSALNFSPSAPSPLPLWERSAASEARRRERGHSRAALIPPLHGRR